LPKHTLDILAQLQTEAPERIPYVLLNEKRYRTVIAKWQRFQQKGRPWQNRDMANNVLRDFKRHLKWTGIKPNGTLFVHTLRKASGQNWANHLPPNITKELMGHASIAATMKFYSQVDKDHRKKAANVIDALVSKGKAKSDKLKRSDAKMTPEDQLQQKSSEGQV